MSVLLVAIIWAPIGLALGLRYRSLRKRYRAVSQAISPVHCPGPLVKTAPTVDSGVLTVPPAALRDYELLDIMCSVAGLVAARPHVLGHELGLAITFLRDGQPCQTRIRVGVPAVLGRG